MSRERWIERDGSKVYLVSENEGWSLMNRGAEKRAAEIVRAGETGVVLLNGSRVSSSIGYLQVEAMKHFADIAREAESA